MKWFCCDGHWCMDELYGGGRLGIWEHSGLGGMLEKNGRLTGAVFAALGVMSTEWLVGGSPGIMWGWWRSRCGREGGSCRAGGGSPFWPLRTPAAAAAC